VSDDPFDLPVLGQKGPGRGKSGRRLMSYCQNELYFESSKKLEELRAKREPLFQRFANNPNEVHLAIEIKFIDDQIAECCHYVQLKKKADLALRGKVGLS
jgi:hypothetical protein